MSESEKRERSLYQQEMDAIHLSESKADETLRMMLEKNRALNLQEAEKRRPNNVWRYASVLAAAAACLALLLFVWPRNSSSAPFAGVRMSGLPVSGQSRSDDGSAVTFAQIFGFEAEDLLPGWAASPAEITAGIMQKETVYEARWRCGKEGKQLHAEAYTYEPALYTVLSGNEPWGNGALLNRDPDTGILYAVFQRQGHYVILWADSMTESDFLSAVQEGLQP